MFSDEYYDKLDPSYREALLKLVAKFEEPESCQAQYALVDFSGKFMTPQKLWNLQLRGYYFNESDPRFIDRRVPSFFYQILGQSEEKWYGKDFEMPKKIVLEDLLFPHKNLDKDMEEYEKESYSFLPPGIRQRHEEMKILYLKIKAVENDSEEWFDAMVESDNLQFVRDNVERRLGDDLSDKALWKKYIGYLKEHDVKLLLETYSKYVRFFIDDTEMLEEYRQAALKHDGPVVVPWRDYPFDFELGDIEMWVSNLKSDKCVPPANTPPLTIQFNAVNPAKPQFPFLSPTIRYILDNASGEVLQKLFKTCKWFRAVKPVNVCYKFEEYSWNRQLEIKEQSIKSVNDSVLHSNLDKIFISTVFHYCSDNPNDLSNLIPKIYRCTAKYVEIYDQNLSLKDLQSFIGNAVDMELGNVRDSGENLYNLQSILQFTPNIKRLHVSGFCCTAETSGKLCELEFENKIDNIHLDGRKVELLDPVKFAEFIKKNCSSKTSIDFYGVAEGSNENADRLNQVLYDAINEQWEENEKPAIRVCFYPMT